MCGATDADAAGGRLGFTAASPIDAPQPAPARAGQPRPPWPVPSTAPHAIAFEQYYNYYYYYETVSYTHLTLPTILRV